MTGQVREAVHLIQGTSDSPKLQCGAYQGRLRRRIVARLTSAIRSLWMQVVLCRCVCLSEICGLGPRIRYRLAKKLDTCGVDLGSRFLWLSNGHLAPNTRAQIRIRDMQHWLSSFPQATLVDLSIFLEGWDNAARSLADQPAEAYRNACNEHSETRVS